MKRLTLRLLLPLLAVGLTTGCLEKPTDGNDGGPDNNNNNTIQRDGQADVAVQPDAAVTCLAADLVAQLTCGSGRKCTLIDPQNTVGCAETGFTQAYSACLEDRPDDCSLGTLCSDADSPGSFVCLPFCPTQGDACLGGKCTHAVALAGGGQAYLCAPADGCDPVSNTGCDAGQFCYLDRTGGFLTFCVNSEGSIAVGQPCSDDYDCVVGHTCFGPAGSGTCTQLCHAGNNAECGGGTCSDIPSTSYGLCFN